ncbi:hypothetical protein At1D1460_42730 [Agrobacterium tumefaciens]|jgi:hypothetical protein|nr:hypothetical protein At1D1460_42730 [Agrobacterium tumefaciens]MBP2540889.1 hypothetical protein [Agrobacterium tumefaciens]MDP9789746.1 hypothetical protein [Agrobacterium tumefaciens]TCV49557.1 hypothetical protein EDB97_11092 [Agrobacterium tumefaciens]
MIFNCRVGWFLYHKSLYLLDFTNRPNVKAVPLLPEML